MRDLEPALDFGTPGGAFARALQTGRGLRDIARHDAAGDQAGLAGDAYALIVSGALFHRVNDLPGLLIQLRRALRPDGLLLAAFPGGDTLSELREALMAAELEAREAAGLRVFPMIDVRAAGQLLQRAGLALPVADSEKVIVRYPDLFALMRDLRAMGATASALIRPGQRPLTRGILLRAAEIYAARFADADGRIRASFETIWISGWAPHQSQQKPLKPGSATMRLEDALNAAKKARSSTGKDETG
jgi:SAM-dependent methyltransferase